MNYYYYKSTYCDEHYWITTTKLIKLRLFTLKAWTNNYNLIWNKYYKQLVLPFGTITCIKE